MPYESRPAPTARPWARLPQVDRAKLVAMWKEWNLADPFAPPAVALLLVGTFSLLTLADPSFARDSAREYRWVIVEPVLFYFLLTDILRTRRGMWRVADMFVAAAVGIAFLGIWQFVRDTGTLTVEGVSRVYGVYQHPNNLALYLGRVLPFVAAVGLFLPRGWRKWIYLASTIPLAITTFLTFSRGAYVGVVVAIAVAVAVGLRWRPGYDERERSGRKIPWMPYISGAALALGLLLIGVAALLPRVPERLVTLGSGELRVLIWESSLRMLRDHPIFGVGPDQFLNQFQAHYITPAQEAERYTAHPHNVILDWWLSLGIMGLLVLIWILWRYFREALAKVRRAALARARDPVGRALALGLLASMLDFAVHGMVDNSYFLMDLAMIFWLSCGLLQVSNQLERGEGTD